MAINENDILSKNYSIDIGKLLGIGADIMKKNLGGFIGFYLLQFVISAAIGAIFGGGITELLMNGGQPAAASGLSIVGNIISYVVGALLTPGIFYVAHKVRNNE